MTDSGQVTPPLESQWLRIEEILGEAISHDQDYPYYYLNDPHNNYMNLLTISDAFGVNARSYLIRRMTDTIRDVFVAEKLFEDRHYGILDYNQQRGWNPESLPEQAAFVDLLWSYFNPTEWERRTIEEVAILACNLSSFAPRNLERWEEFYNYFKDQSDHKRDFAAYTYLNVLNHCDIPGFFRVLEEYRPDFGKEEADDMQLIAIHLLSMVRTKDKNILERELTAFSIAHPNIDWQGLSDYLNKSHGINIGGSRNLPNAELPSPQQK